MTTPINPIVEMLVDGEWVDITPDVRQASASSGGGMDISRSVPNEGNLAEPTQFNFTLNNGVSKAAATLGEAAVYSPMNPMGPYFGKLGRNQRVRVGYDRRIDTFDRDRGPASVQRVDGTFESSTAASQWGTPTGGTWTIVSDTAYRGSKSGRLVVAAGSPALTYARQTSSFTAPVTAGVEYRTTGMLMSPATVANASLVVDWYDAAFGYLSTNATGGTLTAGVWTPVAVTATAPVGAAYAGYGVTIATGTTGQTVYLDDLDMQLTVGLGWGWLPDHVHADGTTILPGERWRQYGRTGAFSVTGGTGQIAGSSTIKWATFEKTYRDVDVVTRFQASDRTTEAGIILRANDAPIAVPAGVDLDGLTGWTSSNSTLAVDTSVFIGQNTQSLRITVTGAPASAAIANVVSASTMWACTEGARSTYYARCWARASVSTTVRLAISWYAEDGTTFVGSTTSDTAVVANTWTSIEHTSTPPSGAYYARFLVSFPSGTAPAAGWQLWIQDPEIVDVTQTSYISATWLPGGTDQLKLYRQTTTADWYVSSVNLTSNVVAGTWYWMRAQSTGQRIQVKLWSGDRADEPPTWNARMFDDRVARRYNVPRTGRVGFMSSGGTAIVQVDSFQVDQWRAHTEITMLPQRFDLSRRDRWVPIQSRGILRRLNQGRKALKSAVALHLEAYSDQSYGWFPMEADSGDSAGNNIAGGLNATISGLTFAAPESSGIAALPGISGLATFDAEDSYLNASLLPHTGTGQQTALWFMRLPSIPVGEITVATIYTSGTARTWRVNIAAGGALRVTAYSATGATLGTNFGGFYGANPDFPAGAWVACTLYLLQSGGNVNWALNHHRPGLTSFWSLNGSFAGDVGTMTGFNFRSSPDHVAAGGFQLTQVMHYSGDLPFVSYDFRAAAAAYDQEEAAARIIRLTTNAGIYATTTGWSGASVRMGPQVPGKLMQLMEDAAQADDGYLIEERADFALSLVTRNSLWNRQPTELDIDAGHLSSPLEGTPDDLPTRNDSTISRPGGSFRRAIKTSGTMNVNPPELDPDGVGVYDEQKEINVGSDELCGSHASWRVSRGTQPEPRYPSITANMAASAYQLDAALAADALSIDIGDSILLTNTEADYLPRYQGVTGYTESVRDLYEWGITWVATPNGVHRTGLINYTARIGSGDLTTQASFTAGVDTQLLVTSPTGRKFVTLAAGAVHWPFDIDVAGVRLRVTMTGVVLNTNPGFESGTTGWVASGTPTLTRDLYDRKEGSYCLQVLAPGAGTHGVVTAAANTVPVAVAAVYRVSGWVKTEIAATAVEIAMDWYNGASAFLSASVGLSTTTTANTWKYITGTVTAPASSASGRVRISNAFAGATRMWVDAVRITAVSSEAGDPQTLTVEQAPVNANFGVTGKVIPAGSPIEIADAMHVGWGESI